MTVRHRVPGSISPIRNRVFGRSHDGNTDFVKDLLSAVTCATSAEPTIAPERMKISEFMMNPTIIQKCSIDSAT